MRLLGWWRRRRRATAQEVKALAEMRRADEADEAVPAETYLSQTRD